jgi:glycosyltransferase involved in cell wall biosynthesis
LELINQSSFSDSIHLDTNFRTVEEIHSILSDVDVLVLPYSQTEESSSGVLAMLLGVGKPIIATDLDIFAGAKDSLISLKSPASSDELATKIIELTSNPKLMMEMGLKAQRRAVDISWGAIGQESFKLYQSVLNR